MTAGSGSNTDLHEERKKRQLDVSLAGGVAWTASAKWVTQLFSWVSLLIVARLLSQSDYGIGEMAGFFFALTNTMAEFGVGTAALHLTELDDDKLHQLHGFSILLCTGVYLISLVLSPFIAWFFHKPDLIPVIAVANLTFFITGFQAVPTGLLQRDMDYRKLSFAEATLYIVQSAVTVIVALSGGGYWALVLGSLAGKAANAAMVMWWKPIGFSIPKWNSIRSPLEFGRQAAFGNLAVTAYMHSDVIVAGRMLGDSALGVYRMAMYLALAPAEKIAMLIMRTAGPLFANVQSEPELVKRYFILLADTLNLLVVPAMAGVIMVAPEAVYVVLGPKWLSAAGPLAWLALYMIVSSMGSLVTQVLVSQRQTKFTMRIAFVNLLLLPLTFVAGAWYNGTTGVAQAWILAAPVTIAPSAIVLFRRIGLSWTAYLKTLRPTLISTAIMAASIAGLKRIIEPIHLPVALQLAVEVLTGASVYCLVLLLFWREKLARYVRFVRSLRGSSGAAGQVSVGEP